GAELEVPTLNGAAKLTVPRGTQTGEVFRIRGEGFPSLGGRSRGDLLVEVVLQTPTKLTKRQEELFRELAAADGRSKERKKKKGILSQLLSFN
ncbi:MAG: DnaJ C-terminal domain-containing protein, partial [Nitrospinota bacterium]